MISAHGSLCLEGQALAAVQSARALARECTATAGCARQPPANGCPGSIIARLRSHTSLLAKWMCGLKQLCFLLPVHDWCQHASAMKQLQSYSFTLICFTARRLWPGLRFAPARRATASAARWQLPLWAWG